MLRAGFLLYTVEFRRCIACTKLPFQAQWCHLAGAREKNRLDAEDWPRIRHHIETALPQQHLCRGGTRLEDPGWRQTTHDRGDMK
jgi:hypothetical protein